ncbi:hypothetical protein [Pseudalkalibacillus caeni]|uniref:Uncharacterized protein n=1 Tax=Exobacillus caeni TaxID=2574798 RepID=A0A5R9F5J9_9BACL|nr:hypothetical protein [Pseudalkalibacillus caeni]TLS35754.1 hypothetical protein FCL54_19060 [Pseudalkalibacillus caeni]
MHFRGLILKGLLAGAVLFFPSDAFAEKNDQAKDHNGKSAEEVISKTVEAAAGKEPGSISPMSEDGQKVEQKPASADHSNSHKPDKSEKTIQLPDTASEKAQKTVNSAVNKAAKKLPFGKPENIQGQQKGQKKGNKPSISNKENHPIDKKDGESSKKSLHTVDVKEKTKKTEVKTKPIKPQPEKKETPPIATSKKDHKKKVEETDNEEMDKSDAKKGSDFPYPQEKLPNDIQVITSSHSTKTPGGSSKDRTGNGSSSGYVDKWLELDQYWNFKLTQPFVSRAHVYRNQWVNAPPSPPPETAPFFLITMFDKVTNND